MDRGAWWATVHRVAQSWTRLKQLSMQIAHVDLNSKWSATFDSYKKCQLTSPWECWESEYWWCPQTPWILVTLYSPLSLNFTLACGGALLSTGPDRGKTALVIQLLAGPEFWSWSDATHCYLRRWSVMLTFPSGNQLFHLETDRGKLDWELNLIILQPSPNSKKATILSFPWQFGVLCDVFSTFHQS